MKHLLPTGMLFLATCACTPCWADPPHREDTTPFSRCTPVGEQVLAEVRGGYDLGGGLQVSFGITRATYVNGELMAQSQLSVRDLSGKAPDPAAPAATWSPTAQQAIQLGAGNSVRMDLLPPGALVIQNSLNNQNIRNLTVIDATTNSLQLLRGINALSSLRDVLTLPAAAR